MNTVRIALLVLMLGLTLMGCKKDETSTEPSATETGGVFSEQDKSIIRLAYKSIALSADSVLKVADPMSGFRSRVATYAADPTVETAWVTSNALFVRFKKGGLVGWHLPSSVVVPPYVSKSALDAESTPCLLKPSELIGNTKVALVNQQYGDEDRQYCRDVVTNLQAKFTSLGFTVTVKNGSAANVGFFGSEMKQFGTVFYISHGCYDGTNTWQATGEEADIDAVMTKYPSAWLSNRIAMVSITEKRGGKAVVVPFYLFSSRYIDSVYVPNDFPGSMIYLVACQGMKDPGRQVAQSFVSKGAKGVIGWDETNCLGQSTGKLLFTTLLCGKKLKDAVNALPAEARLDKCAIAGGANLVYYPSSADSLRLMDEVKATLLITSPKKDSTYASRNLTLAGSLVNGDSITGGIVEINGIATTLSIVSTNRKAFSQPIVINNGSNIVHIACNGKLQGGKCAVVDTAITVKGSFSTLDLWTELRWNTDRTDVDFHLLPSTATFPTDLWTSKDCNWKYLQTSWGGYLDVDDTSGYGPEHITMPVAGSGTYRLFVHYWDDKGLGATSAFVAVSVRGGASQNFGPYLLTVGGKNDYKGDIMEVCTITYPSGVVTPVGTKTTLTKLGKDEGVGKPKK